MLVSVYLIDFVDFTGLDSDGVGGESTDWLGTALCTYILAIVMISTELPGYFAGWLRDKERRDPGGWSILCKVIAHNFKVLLHVYVTTYIGLSYRLPISVHKLLSFQLPRNRSQISINL